MLSEKIRGGREKMKLYIKQRVFSIGDKYNIYDETERLIYHVTSQLFSLGAKLFLMNEEEEEQYFIKQRITFLFKEYEIYKGDQLCASIEQKLGFLKSRLAIKSRYGDFEINGDLWDLDYEIIKDGDYFGSVHKVFLSWGDSYELDIPKETDSAFFSAVVIAIDHCLHNESSH